MFCAGLGTETQGQAEAAARAMLAQGVRAVLVKRGTAGSLLVTQDGACIRQPTFKAAKVRITQGYTNSRGTGSLR